MADNRQRNFATIVYPDSAPEGWLTVLAEMHVPCFVSPLHDKDILPSGELKKPHYHVLFMCEGKKSAEQIQEMFDSIGGVGQERVISIRAYARYLCHLDNPEKAPYNQDDLKMFGGADYFSICNLAIDKYKAIGEMVDFCEENNIYSYAQLFVYCRENRSDWFRVLCDSATFVIKEYLKTRYWENKEDVRERCY